MKKKAGTSIIIVITVILSCFSISPFASAAQSGTGDGFESRGGGLVLSKPDKSRAMDSNRFAAIGPLASSVDLTDNAPPIGNQGSLGSCTAWATGYYYKSWLEKIEHPSWNLNNSKYQFSPAFIYNLKCDGRRDGISFDDAFQVLTDHGCVDMEYFPYDVNNLDKPDGKRMEAAEQYRISWSDYFFAEYAWAHQLGGPYNRDAEEINEVKSWLNSGKPLVMGIPIYNDFPGTNGNPNSVYYTSRDHYTASDFEGGGGHAVFIAGYDDNINPGGSTPDTRGGFLVLNSWGSNWNGSGTIWISYKFVKEWVAEAWCMEDLDSTPRISSITPSVAEEDDIVTIKGENFGTRRNNTSRVAFPGLISYPNYAHWDNNEIRVAVPGDVMEGDLHVYDWDGCRSNPVKFRPGPSSNPGNRWFFAEGSTWPGFDEWILVQNPNESTSLVDVVFMMPDGPVKGPELKVNAGSRTTLHVNEHVPAGKDVSVMIVEKNGVSVCCERAMYFQTHDGKWGSHDCVASPGTSTTWYLAEGATWPGFEEWVLIMNPYSHDQDVTVTYQTAYGNRRGPKITIPAGSRYSLPVHERMPGLDISVKIECEDITWGVVVERAMYMSTPDGKRGCHNSLGTDRTSNSWGLAEGATWPGYEEWVLVQNPVPGKSVGVKFCFLTGDGLSKVEDREVPAGGRISLRVNDFVPNEDVSTMVFTTDEEDQVVVERAMYIATADGKSGAHNAPASKYRSNNWYLPEGCTAQGFDEWVSVVNPDLNEPVSVNLTFMTPDGPVAGPKATLAPGSRETFNVNNYVSGDVSTKVESAGYVLCERAMYVSTADGKAGAHCSLGVLSDFLSEDSESRGIVLGEMNVKSPDLSGLRLKYVK